MNSTTLLRQRERAVIQALQAAWARVKAAILRLIQRFLDVLKKARARLTSLGEDGNIASLPFTWLFEHNRLPALQQELTKNVMDYVDKVDTLTQQVAQDATALGREIALKQLAAAGEVVTPPVPIVSAPLSFAWIAGEVIRSLNGILLLAVENLHPSVEWSLDQALTRLFTRARGLLVTALYSAYRDTFVSTLGASGEDWIWKITEPDACPFCKGMDGTRHPASEPFDSHPHCRCEAVSVQSI